MKEIAIQYLNNQIASGVTHIALATKLSARVFFIEDLRDFILANDENVMLRDHDGVRLKELGDAPRKYELVKLYTKALCRIPLTKYDKDSCEKAVADHFHGEVTGGNSDCPWDVLVKGFIKIQVKGIGGAMSIEARTAESPLDLYE